ncbi:MAG: hypothetical protein ACXAC2_24655 [Candidatus Kariarchaeaceae archaeon]|jgi:hypothetical protein
METGVESNVSSKGRDLVDTSANPLFQTRKVTGDILSSDDDVIAHKLQDDESDNYYYWMFIVVLILFMALILAIN